MKKILLNKNKVEQIILDIAKSVLDMNLDPESMAIVGIRTRGAVLAQRVVKAIYEQSGQEFPLGILDITLYRDDLSGTGAKATVRTTEIDFDVTGKRIILLDDVLFSGRTVRAALDAITDFGRPKQIQLWVLIDRGHRELPFKADFTGLEVNTNYTDVVSVKLEEIDGEDEVIFNSRK